MKLKIEVDDYVIFWAFRYTLGRASYAPQGMYITLNETWQQLSSNIKKMIHAEIDEAERRGGLVDAVGWREIKKLKIY